MTPRTILQFRERDVDAASLAESSGFDVVPISRPDGKVLEFWEPTRPASNQDTADASSDS